MRRAKPWTTSAHLDVYIEVQSQLGDTGCNSVQAEEKDLVEHMLRSIAVLKSLDEYILGDGAFGA